LQREQQQTGARTNHLAEISLRTILTDELGGIQQTNGGESALCLGTLMADTTAKAKKKKIYIFTRPHIHTRARASYLYNTPAATGAPNKRPPSKKYDKGVGDSYRCSANYRRRNLGSQRQKPAQAIGTTQINGPLKNKLRARQLHGHV
jgi:hypothetical protein